MRSRRATPWPSSSCSGWATSGSIAWWLALVLVSAVILHRTRLGNWIFATGGSASAAAGGRPAARGAGQAVLFMAVCAALLAAIQVLAFTALIRCAASGRNSRPSPRVIGGTPLAGETAGGGTVFGALTLASCSWASSSPASTRTGTRSFGALLLLAVVLQRVHAALRAEGAVMNGSAVVELRALRNSSALSWRSSGCRCPSRRRGAVLLGDNGAGKSTLIKISRARSGLTRIDVWVDGFESRFASPREALTRASPPSTRTWRSSRS